MANSNPAETSTKTAQTFDVHSRPLFLRSSILHTHYDGITDDLLTAGAGRTGLAGLSAQDLLKAQDPRRPTRAELRRNAIFSSHIGLIDRSAGAGYGRLYGPGVIDGKPVNDGRVAGDEYLAYVAAFEGGADAVVTVMVQIPESFNRTFPCILTAPSSGSRGIYGAVATAGEWGLQHGCAVVYTDKGTGIGVHELDRNLAYLIDGEYADADVLGPAAHFRAELSESDRDVLKQFPHRLAFKHAHSRRNVEQHWGRDVLRSIEFAFYVLNLHFRRHGVDTPFTRLNTKVIASNISNGGAASLRAAEQDRLGLIDAVVVAEPAVQPRNDPKHDRPFAILYKRTENGQPADKKLPHAEHSRPILDYMSFLNVYQPCLFNPERCKWLQQHGFLDANNPVADAQNKINAYGILEQQNPLQLVHYSSAIPLGVSVTFANSYGRFGVADNLCGYSFAATDPNTGEITPVPNTDALPVLAAWFAIGNGIPPYGVLGLGDPATAPRAGISIINNRTHKDSNTLKTDEKDQNAPGALALRRVVMGDHDSVIKQHLSDDERKQHDRITKGLHDVRATADLNGRPAIIVHGQADGVIAPNHTSRPYYGRNQMVEGSRSKLCYYEVMNAHHFDAFNSSPPFPALAENYIPLHYYFIAALDLMYSHLGGRGPDAARQLPESQVIPTVKRGRDEQGNLLPILAGVNLPPLDTSPEPKWAIKFDRAQGTLTIPDAKP